MRLLALALLGLMCSPIAAMAQINYCTLAESAAITHPASETTYTLGTPDQCNLLVFLNTGAETVTLPVPGTTFFPPGFTFRFLAFGSGGVTLSAATGTLVNNGATLAKTTGNGADCSTDGTSWWCKN